ncbi:hypothetical protein [Caballeronia sp. LZ001]|uniref:pilus assembly PilX family protein n=1 Tax=Caballeronia sp. LZ001 TaxID=3038553 RepID=UPI0028670E47|nr:hypothetical protein [Caballeronia sp. LZ001]MDR5804106.1 hypothetical protein [Caballeronia sp. LZ001]
MRRRARSRGTVLPIVLSLAAMMLVTASAWLQASLVATRTAVSARERMQAFHAADSALVRCVRMIADAPVVTSSGAQEPVGWRSKASFEGASAVAIEPFGDWPYARRAPQCLIEAWSHTDQAVAVTSYLVTARGFGASPETEAWLQSRIDGATRHWRRVVAKPF